MCRICGRMVKCIFDSMPSRTIARPSPSVFTAQFKPQTSIHTSRHLSSIRNLERKSISSKSSPSSPHLQPLSIQTRSLQTTAHQSAELQSSSNHSENASEAIQSFLTQTSPQPQTAFTAQPMVASQVTTLTDSSTLDTTQRPLVLSKSIQALLPVLAAQTPHFITTHIHSFPYLLTEGDTLRLPFHLHGVAPGDILRFNRATILGSRDYTLKAAALPKQIALQADPEAIGKKLGELKHIRGEPFTNGKRTGEPSYIDERLFECRVRVMSLDSGPLVVTEKKKKRNRRLKKVTSKHKYTVVKVMEVKVKTVDEILEQEKGQVVME